MQFTDEWLVHTIDPLLPEGTVAAIRHTWGFDKPIYDQYLLTMKKVFTATGSAWTWLPLVLPSISCWQPA